MADIFTTDGTVGVEEEFYAVDPDTLMPATDSDELLETPPDALAGHLDMELFTCVLETQSPVLDGPDAVRDAVETQRQALLDHAQAHGYDILATGLHPAAEWRELRHVTKPRYRGQLDRIQYPQHRNLTAGLHIHVGMADADTAVKVANRMRPYLPPLLAASANSPFWYGHDTGLASARAIVFENLPTTGIPTRFDSWEAFQRYEQRMLETDSIGDRGAVWWDVRPHSEYGTVEVRIMDSQIRPARTEAFARLVHGLATHLQDIEPGTDTVRHELLEENKWRAARYGQDASFIRADDTVTLQDWLPRVAAQVGVDTAHAETLLEPTGTAIQRDAYADGDLNATLPPLRIAPHL